MASRREQLLARLQQLDELGAMRAALHGRNDPVAWITGRLGEFVWSKQREILASVVNNRRTAVPSCYARGKSWLAARIAGWWIDTHPPGSAFVMTTASTNSQVEAILWKELRRAHSVGNLPGRMNMREWYLQTGEGKDELVAFGRKPADKDATAFQGIHARYVLVIIDEASGVSDELFDAAEGLIANEESRILLIGNPENAISAFQRACLPGSGWNVIRIPATVTPNFTGEAVPDALRAMLVSRLWVEEKRRSWTESNPLWTAKVMAEFPENTEDGLIPISWIRDAQERHLAPGHPIEIGVDVGGGGDKSVVAVRRGPVVDIIRRDRDPDTMRTCGKIIADLASTRAIRAKVDEVGIGRGVVDRARELRKPVFGVNVGQQASDTEAFANLRAEGYWALRERFREGDIMLPRGTPESEDLVAQLVDLRFKRTSRGQIQIESKDEIRRRGKSSPDEADAVMLAFIQPDNIGSYELLFVDPDHKSLDDELGRLRRELGLHQ